MSIFRCDNHYEYLNLLGRFLRMNRPDFLAVTGLPLRNRAYADFGNETVSVSRDAVVTLELAANCRARRSEDPGNRFNARLDYACSYAGHNDVSLAAELGVGRWTVCDWRRGYGRPGRVAEIARILDVPLRWLLEGNVDELSASSRIGARAGAEAADWRERLYGLSIAATLDAGSVPTYVQKGLRQEAGGGHGKRLIVEIDLEPLGRANHDHEEA